MLEAHTIHWLKIELHLNIFICSFIGESKMRVSSQELFVCPIDSVISVFFSQVYFGFGICVSVNIFFSVCLNLDFCCASLNRTLYQFSNDHSNRRREEKPWKNSRQLTMLKIDFQHQITYIHYTDSVSRGKSVNEFLCVGNYCCRPTERNREPHSSSEFVENVWK